jgi:hypothetical protein
MATELLKRRSVPSSMIRRVIVVGIVLFAISSFDQAMAEIINGGFETVPVVNKGFDEDTSFSGWNISFSGNTSCCINQDNNASEGKNYCELFSFNGGWAILQTDSGFSALPGKSVSFDYRCLFIRTQGDEVFEARATLATDMGAVVKELSAQDNWITCSFTVPPDAQSTSLKFECAAGPGEHYKSFGVTILDIDNVQITPEPCIIALLVFGLGGLPIVLWQRWSDRKKNTNG